MFSNSKPPTERARSCAGGQSGSASFGGSRESFASTTVTPGWAVVTANQPARLVTPSEIAAETAKAPLMVLRGIRIGKDRPERCDKVTRHGLVRISVTKP